MVDCYDCIDSSESREQINDANFPIIKQFLLQNNAANVKSFSGRTIRSHLALVDHHACTFSRDEVLL